MASKSFWDNIQFGLDLAGAVPLVGNIVDLANAGISVVRGDALGAGLRMAQAIPGAGLGVTAGKLGVKGTKKLIEKGGAPLRMGGAPAGKTAADFWPQLKGGRLQGLTKRYGKEYLKRRPILRTVSLAKPEPEFAEGLKGSDVRQLAEAVEDRETARQEAMEKMIDDQPQVREKAKEDAEKKRQADVDTPLMKEGWQDRKKVLKDQIFDLEENLGKTQKARREQLGNRLINAMSRAGNADPDYWSKNPDKLQAIIREGSKLGDHSFTKDDVRGVLRNTYRKAVHQKKKDFADAELAQADANREASIDDWNIQRAIDRQDEVLPTAALRRRGDRMKEGMPKGYQGPKEFKPEGEDFKPLEMEASLKGAKKELEDMGLAENEAYSDWMEAAAKREEVGKAERKKQDEAFGDKLIAAEEQAEAAAKDDQKVLQEHRDHMKKKRSWATQKREDWLEPVEQGVADWWKSVAGGGKYR